MVYKIFVVVYVATPCMAVELHALSWLYPLTISRYSLAAFRMVCSCISKASINIVLQMHQPGFS